MCAPGVPANRRAPPALVSVFVSVFVLVFVPVFVLVFVLIFVLIFVPILWFLNNVACNSLAIISNIEIASLELQRL